MLHSLDDDEGEKLDDRKSEGIKRDGHHNFKILSVSTIFKFFAIPKNKKNLIWFLHLKNGEDFTTNAQSYKSLPRNAESLVLINFFDH